MQQRCRRVDAPHAHRLRREVWLHLRALGPSTCDEVEARSGLAHQTCSARFNELARVGCIAKTGERRATRSGRNAWVYEVTGIEPL